MHQDPEHNDYDDDDYNYYPQYNDYGYPSYSKNFKFDWTAWEKWLADAIKEIVNENDNVWLFGNYKAPPKKNKANIKKLSDKYFMYLGKNQYDESVWKAKYFISDQLDTQYKNHIASNAAHFLQQPDYYKGMFENLN
ncbi:hypothetical protein EB169_10110 [archaeon]|nr:hypothetical protein [archaeon]